MTESERNRLQTAETNVKTLDNNIKTLNEKFNKRILDLEDQMAACLQFIQYHAKRETN